MRSAAQSAGFFEDLGCDARRTRGSFRCWVEPRTADEGEA